MVLCEVEIEGVVTSGSLGPALAWPLSRRLLRMECYKVSTIMKGARGCASLA
jgi:hypothetical protein